MTETIWYETNMTANDKPAPLKASASSEYQGASFYPAYQAFDGKVGAVKFWRTYTDKFPYWLKIDFNKRIQVNKVRLQATDSDLPSHPTEFKVYSSSDDVEYKELGHFTNINSWSANETREFKITDTTARYLRINVISSGASYATIGEVTYGYGHTNKTFISHDGEYKKFIQKIEEITGLDNAIPKMGSNTAPSGVASASSVSSGNYPAWKAFDKSTADIGWIASTRTGWLQYQFPIKKIIVRYGVTNPSSASTVSYATRAPKDWEFQGSNDGANWDTLDTRTNQTNWGSAERREFTIINPKSYLYYRINVTANNNAGDMAINKLEMYEQPVAPENAYWSTISNSIPSSQQFLEQGMDNLSPLLERTVTELEPMTMINKSEILGVGEIGKVFSETIDLKKYIDIRSIRTEVK